MEIDPIIKQAIEIGIKLGIEAYRNERNAKKFLYASLMQKDVLDVESLES